MRVVVTPVGTSLFANYLNQNSDGNFQAYFETIKDAPSTEWDDLDFEINALREASTEFITEKRERASAELQSIAKIRDELNDDIEVRLLASDTVASRLVAEILADKVSASVLDDNVLVEFELNDDLIGGLQVDDAEAFTNQGMTQLIQRLDNISANAGGWTQTAFNITGGYKVTLPYLTIMAQLYRVPLYYTFEETDTLIKIPQAPLVIDWGLIERYSNVLMQIDEGIDNWSAFRSQHYQAVQDLEAFIEIDDEDALLSPIGRIFWEHYQKYFVVELPSGSYFDHNSTERSAIDKAIGELYERLETVLGPNFPESSEECTDKILKLSHNDDLNHAGAINSTTFIFKSTKSEHVRLAYTFRTNKKEITKITAFELGLKPNLSPDYPAIWKAELGNRPTIKDSITRTLDIPQEALTKVTRRRQNVQSS